MQGGGLFGVGRDDGGEVATDNVLLRHMDDVREAKGLEGHGDEAHTRTVDRSVDDLHVVVALDCVGRKRDRSQIADVAFVHLSADDLDERLVALKVDVRYAADLVHLSDGVLVVRSDHLRAVVPIGLVAVVLLRVMRSGDDDAALAAEVTDGIRRLGCRPEGVEEVDFNTIGGEDVSRDLGEAAAVVTAVVADDDLDLLQVCELLLEVVREALRGGADGVDVHAVRPRAHDAAQPAGAKLEVFVESLDEIRRVILVEQGLHLIVILRP